MDLLAAFKQNLKNNFSVLSGKGKLLVAVSGGADRVVLTDLIFNTGLEFAIAHCNFQLRGKESERDETFVRGLAEKYKCEIFIERFDTNVFAHENKLSVQEAARKLRYDWFEQLTLEHSFSNIVTAHHANDNVETVLMHLFRGTGLKGLTGIPAAHNKIIRPLLPFQKQDILGYAAERKLHFVEDSSNASDKYTRNFFRNELIPSIEKIYPNAQNNIDATITRLSETYFIFQQAIELKRKKLFTHVDRSADITVPVLELKKLIPQQTWLWELFKDFGMTASQLPELIKLLDADNGAYLTTGEYRIIKNRNRLLITSALQNENVSAVTIDESDKRISFPPGEMKLEMINADNFKLTTDQNICCIDASQLQFPLLLRKWKQGDYFYPLGMNKKKKLSRFFIDQKLSLKDKKNIWVLESNKRIVWIVNQRLDDRFKIKP